MSEEGEAEKGVGRGRGRGGGGQTCLQTPSHDATRTTPSRRNPTKSKLKAAKKSESTIPSRTDSARDGMNFHFFFAW